MNILKGKKVFLTGGAGFIGSYIAESLLRKGANVTVYDNFSTGLEENLERIKNKIHIIKGDILDYDFLRKSSRNHDIISHQAAQLEILKAMDNPVDDLKTNTIGTLNVLKACVANHIKRFIAPSSAGVYGQAITIPETEDHPTEPQWAYGISKLACEKYAKIFEADYGLKQTMLRYAIVYGPREWFGRVLTIFLKRILDNEPPVIFGDGQQVRDFIFVKDVVSFHNLCLENNKTIGNIYNVSSGEGITIEKLANICIKVTKKKINPIFENVSEGDNSKIVLDRKRIPSELRVLLQSNELAYNHTGWRPKTSIEEGIKLQWEWLKKNKGRYDFKSIRV